MVKDLIHHDQLLYNLCKVSASEGSRNSCLKQLQVQSTINYMFVIFLPIKQKRLWCSRTCVETIIFKSARLGADVTEFRVWARTLSLLVSYETWNCVVRLCLSRVANRTSWKRHIFDIEFLLHQGKYLRQRLWQVYAISLKYFNSQ
jgi:hypothetical protein